MKKISSSQVFRLLAEELQHSFSPQALTELARQTQFVQRTSKFRAQDLSSLCIGMGQDTASHSLARL
ncbi:IS4 family transposase, partial [Bacillus cereus]